MADTVDALKDNKTFQNAVKKGTYDTWAMGMSKSFDDRRGRPGTPTIKMNGKVIENPSSVADGENALKDARSPSDHRVTGPQGLIAAAEHDEERANFQSSPALARIPISNLIVRDQSTQIVEAAPARNSARAQPPYGRQGRGGHRRPGRPARRRPARPAPPTAPPPSCTASPPATRCPTASCSGPG